MEFYEPYQYSTEEINDARKETGLSMLGLNTRRGKPDSRERVLAAIPGKEINSKYFIDEAVESLKTGPVNSVRKNPGPIEQHWI